jgi:PAS domain S-box-containing protein
MRASSESVLPSEDTQSSRLPDLDQASRAELQLTLEQLARANRRLALLYRVATVLMSQTQSSFSDLFESIAEEIGARYFFYQRVDSIRPEILILAAASQQRSEEEAIVSNEFLTAAATAAPANQAFALGSSELALNETFARLQSVGLKSFMRVPLLAQDRLLGVVSFASVSSPLFPQADQEFVRTFADQLAAAVERERLVQQLKESEQIYRGAVITGRLASWETNMVTRERIWTKEGMEMFGLDLPNGRGVIGGDSDEFRLTLHPEDRHKVAEFHQTADRIDSYPAEYRIVRSDGRLLWMSGRGRVIERDADGKARRVANIVVDVTERKKSEERTKLLIDELNHRVKNTLSTVQAIVAQSLRDERDARDARKAIEARLQSLSSSHNLLTRANWEGAALHDVVSEAMRPFLRSNHTGQISVEGQQVRLRPKVALSLGMALHELATNASKYGALSIATGQVEVWWAPFIVDNATHLEFFWRERDGPLVKPRSRRGFGSRLIEQGLAHELGGRAHLEYLPSGINCKISFPLLPIEEEAQ